MIEASGAPATAEELREAILSRYETLSKRLKQIAKYILEQPDTLALETLAVIAERSGVQPSAVVRFAQAFGFEGATQMQRLFRDGLVASHSALGYGERVRRFGVDAHAAELLSEFIEGNSLALQGLTQTVRDEELSAAIGLIESAETVLVVAVRRSFAVASYLAYSLLQAGKRTLFVDGAGAMGRQQAQIASPNDLVIAISYQPYADETAGIVETAIAKGAKLLSITDSPVSPIGRQADLTLEVREPEIRGFRTLSASMCLAQALAIGFAIETSHKPAARKPAAVRPASRRPARRR